MFRLRVVPARGKPFERSFDAEEVVVGRAPSCDLVLSDRFLSRTHARLYLDDGVPMVEDLGSYNGTFVNGARVVEPVSLSPGDSVRLSTSTISLLPSSGEGDGTGAMPRREQPESSIAGATVVRPASDLLPDLEPASSHSDSVEDLVRYTERLALLNEVHRALGGTARQEELLELILDRLFDHFRPEEAAILLRAADGSFVPEATRAVEGNLPSLDFRTLEREVAERGLAVVVLDTLDDERFAAAESILSAGVRSLMAAPLLDPSEGVHDGTLGMIVLASSAAVRQFNEGDLEVLVSLASVAAMRIRNAALMEEAVERRRLEEELNLARSIQVALLTEDLPEIPGWEIHAGNIPSRLVSGDFYKAVLRGGGGGELVLLLADVSGKGMAASLLTASLEAMIAGLVEETADPVVVCDRVGPLLHRRTPTAKYATAFLAVVEPEQGRVRYVNAGHNPGLVVGADGSLRKLGSTGQPLGLLQGSTYRAAELVLSPGDLMVLYSDGITEAADPEEREYGVERLVRVMTEGRSEPLAEIGRRLEADLESFADGVAFADDRTVLMLRRGRA